MPLGRFTAYFFVLMTVCLVAFPRAVGAPPDAGRQKGGQPSSCSEVADNSLTWAASASSLLRYRRHAHPARETAPFLLRRLEAGGAAFLPSDALSAGSGIRRLSAS